MAVEDDINIDMLENHDQISISRTCRLMPIYREIKEDYGLCVMNKKTNMVLKGQKQPYWQYNQSSPKH